MKKLLYVMMLMPLVALADTEEVDGIKWRYVVNDGEARVGDDGSWPSAIPSTTKGAITIPTTLGGMPVTSIGSSAFRECDALTSVTIPSSVRIIESSAFSYCRGLTSMVVPEGVTSIGFGAFWGCSGLLQVSLPNTVTNIGSQAFRECTRLQDYGGFVIVRNVLYDYFGTTSIVQVPEGVRVVDAYAFWCNSPEKIILPEGVEEIGASAFEGCKSLVDVSMPESVRRIGDRAFEDTKLLKDFTGGFLILGDCLIRYEDDTATEMEVPYGVRVIGDNAVQGLNLEGIILPEGVKTLGMRSFSGCGKLKTISFPASIESVGEYCFEYCQFESVYIQDLSAWCRIDFAATASSPFSYSTKLFVGDCPAIRLRVPSSVERIGKFAFAGLGTIVSVEMGDGVKEIGESAFCDCQGLKSVTVTAVEVGEKAFYRCQGLKTVTVSSGVERIGDDAFSFCSSLSALVLSNGIVRIGDRAFYDCDGLSSCIEIPSTVKYIGEEAFRGCRELTDVHFATGVESIGWCAFQDCGIKEVFIPSSVTNVGCRAFGGAVINVDEGNPVYCSALGVLYDRCKNELQNCPKSFSGVMLIPEGIKSIGVSAFNGCASVTSILWPEGLESIGDSAFSGCESITSVVLPDGVVRIDDCAFYNCRGLHTVVIPLSVKSMGQNVFGACPQIENVTISSVFKMSDVFGGYYDVWRSLKEVVIPSGATEIVEDAFRGCGQLSSITIPSSVESCGAFAFYGCDSLRTVYLESEDDVARVRQMLYDSGVDVESLTFDVEKWSVTFNPEGGFAEWMHAEVSKNKMVGTLPSATRDGYEFLGWFTAAVGGTQVTVATIVTEDVTYYAQWRKIDETPIATYGPWGEAEAVKNPDKLGPTMLTDMTLELNGAAGAVGDVVAAFRGDTGALCGLGKVMDESGTLSMVCYAPTGVKLHFKVWVAASGVEEPVVMDCDAKSDLTAPTSGAFLSGHALVVSDDKDLTISLGSADWHTVSFNVLPEDPSPAAVFGSVKSKIAAVTQGIEFWMPGKSSSLKAIEIGKGYWVNTKVDDVEWTVSGKTDPKTEIALEEGWNLVGYAPETEGAVQAVLKTALAAKAVDYVTYGVEFYPGGTLKKMEPGKAYWVHAKKAWRLVYDEPVESSKFKVQSAARLMGAAPVPTYGPWGESEAVKNPDKLGPTFLTDMAVEIDGEPAAEGDVVAVFRGDTGALCGLGKVMDDSGTLTVVCYAPKGVTLSFKVWLSESGVEEAVVVKCDSASKLVAPESGAFYAGHEISCSTAELIETIVPGEKVEIDTGLIGYTASGLPSGLKYSKTSGLITGAATKPTAAEGVVAKFTKSGAETEELTIVVTAIPKVSVAMEGVNSPGDTDGCKVTGAGAYLVGKTVTLKATVPKGTVFMGWGDDEGVVSTQATYSFTMGKENVALVARFKKEVMSVGCETLSSKEQFPAGVLGAEGGIKLDISTESGVKSVKVDKLPSGMKYDSKTGLITGAPTKAGDNTVVITVTAKSGAVAKKEIEVKVAAMPVMAVGTFFGFVSVGEDNFGAFTLTTTDAGKLTAKVVTAAGTVSFSGTCWDAVEKGVYRATLTTKKGEKLTLTLDSTAGWDANQLSGEFTTAEIAATKKAAAVPSRSYSVSAQKNAFGKTWYFTAVGNETTGWTLDYAATAKAAALTVTVKADGTTAIAGNLPGLPDKKGKATSFKISASGFANVGMMREGAIAADFAPGLTVNKVKTILAIKTNLWFDRKNDHGSGVGEARFVK